MTVQAIILSEQTDLLEAARGILAVVWQEAALDSLLVSTWVEGSDAPQSLMLEDPNALEDADPFAPVMHVNNAGRAALLFKENKNNKIGYFLRPCELRSFWALIGQRQVDPARSLLISSDCLGAYPDEDYHWRATTSSDPEALTRQSLRFAPQGGILPSRNKHACQLCETPCPKDADVQIEFFGLQSSDQLLLEFADPGFADRILKDVTNIPLDKGTVEHRNRVLKDIATWRRNSLDREAETLDTRHLSPESLLAHLAECEACALRLQKHCPGFAETYWPQFAKGGETPAAYDWISSCGGCGICDHQCPNGFPLFDVIKHLHLQYRLDRANPGQPATK